MRVKMRILGLDPGSSRIGFGVIEAEGSRLKLVDYGTMEAKNLVDLSQKLETLLNKYRPGLAAVETLYFAKNHKTAIKVAQARGVMILKLMEKNLKMTELGPMQIKLAVAGYGKTDKSGVAKMVKMTLNVKNLKGYDDASDALAIAIAAASRLKIGA